MAPVNRQTLLPAPANSITLSPMVAAPRAVVPDSLLARKISATFVRKAVANVRQVQSA
jgi:hypothetical protein